MNNIDKIKVLNAIKPYFHPQSLIVISGGLWAITMSSLIPDDYNKLFATLLSGIIILIGLAWFDIITTIRTTWKQ